MPQTYPADLALLTQLLADSYGRAWTAVVNEQARVAHGIVQNPRLWRQRDRLAEVRQRIELEMTNVDALARHWVSREYPRFYAAGAEAAATQLASPFTWTQTHREAVALLARDTFDDLLEATQHVREDTKRFLREVIRPAVLQDQLVGKTAKQTAANVTRYLEGRGITSVVYKNGARVGLGTYAEMAIRTKTAVAYNIGTLNQGAEFGVKFYEVFDGPSCGWTGHNDVDLANGSIRSAAEAAAFSIAHPRCARSFGPRPDITTKAQAGKAEPTAGGQAKDRPEAAARPLEAAARTSASRQAATARRTAAGLQNRAHTPAAVLARRAAMIQNVRTPRTRTPRAPGQGQPPATTRPPRTTAAPPPEPPPPARLDFSTVTTPGEVGKMLGERFGIRIKGFASKYVEYDQAVDVATAFEQMALRFPQVAAEIKEVRFANLGSGVLGQASRQGQFLEIQNAYNRAAFDRVLKASHEAGFLSQPGVQATVRHEFGHHIDYYLGRVLSQGGRHAYAIHEGKAALWVRDTLMDFYKVDATTASQVVRKNSALWQRVKADLSEYGTTNAKEFMAEVIAEATGPGPVRPLAQFVFDRLQAVLASGSAP